MRTEPVRAQRDLPPQLRLPRSVRPGVWVGLGALAVFWLARIFPEASWSVYGLRVYPMVANALGWATGRLPFVLGEVTILVFFVLLLALGIRQVRRRRREGSTRLRAALSGAALGLALCGWVWAYGVGVYALNYARPGPERLFGLAPMPDVGAAEALVEQIGLRTDALRATLPEDGDGVVVVTRDLRELDSHVTEVQSEVMSTFGMPAITNGRTKWLAASPIFGRYSVGMYMWQTGEPTVVHPPYPAIWPATLAHERAHRAGFAGEGEADFVGIVTTWHSDRPEVRYAGWLSLWLSIGRPTADRHPGVLRDHWAIWLHQRERVGFEAPIVRRAHDVALRGVGEREGVASYGLVVDLALRYLDTYGMPPDPLD